ncbi:MAG: hypothetical protein AAF587_34615 [Bacteroidota bacterium]
MSRLPRRYWQLVCWRSSEVSGGYGGSSCVLGQAKAPRSIRSDGLRGVSCLQVTSGDGGRDGGGGPERSGDRKTATAPKAISRGADTPKKGVRGIWE